MLPNDARYMRASSRRDNSPRGKLEVSENVDGPWTEAELPFTFASGLTIYAVEVLGGGNRGMITIKSGTP
jgi:hypothetical protein